jgi:serine/threonine-protein kinase
VEPRGRLLGERYELLVLLASGGMGRVWRARDVLLERPVAVKVLRSEFADDQTFRARFRAEAQHTAALHHPNIAAVHDYGEMEDGGEGLAYLVMELVEGESLADLLERVGRLEPARTIDMLRQTSSGLAVAHAAGVVHRDVKPGNVLVGTDDVVRITDFGIAWSASSVALTGTGQVVGTAHYLSPEQAAGEKATPASDVYALGAVAYECLAGRRAFDGENSVQVALKQIREEPDPLPADVPAGLRAVVERAMAKDPAARYPDGAALRAAVEELDRGGGTAPIRMTGTTGTAVLPLPPFTPEPSPVTAASAGGWRRMAPLFIGALLAMVAVGVVVGLLANRDRTPLGDAPTSTTTATTPPAVEVVAADFLGRPVEQVRAELTALGLQVQLTAVTTADVPPGQVVGVAPDGSLAPGAVVSVSHAVAPPREGNGNGNADDKGNGPGNGPGDGPGNGPRNGPKGPGNDDD